MQKIIFFFGILFLSVDSFAGYPIPARPLRLLVVESEYIIRGKVVKLGEEKENDSPWENEYAIITISEVWQGVLKEKEVKVYFTSGMICPQPGVFYADEEVLTFIDKREKADGYEIHALSYGVKHALTAADFSNYKTRIIEMQQILKLPDSPEKENRTTEWLVSCAEKKATRWDGVYELGQYGNFMTKYLPDGSFSQKDIELSTQQRNRLYNAFIQTDTLDYNDLNLVDLAKGINDCIIVDKLKNALPLCDTTYLFEANGIMSKIVNLTQHAGLSDIESRFSKLYSWEEKNKAERYRLFHLFMQMMKDVPCHSKPTTGDQVTG